MQPNVNVPTNVPAPVEGLPATQEEPVASSFRPVHPMIQRGHEAFRRDLPALMKTHYRKWVAYHGDRRLGFGKSKVALLREWLSQGIPEEELVVRSVEPEMTDDDGLPIPRYDTMTSGSA